mmetsp:Transcript_20706/g.61766  ORF Transcript_20706/g.61766 Transcript_20706/m.61766 type:complete len:133 (-) Transcript_20706:222-620(-)
MLSILRLDDDHIVKRIYLGLKDKQLVGAGERSGTFGAAGPDGTMVVSELGEATKEAAKEYVETLQNASLKSVCRGRMLKRYLAPPAIPCLDSKQGPFVWYHHEVSLHGCLESISIVGWLNYSRFSLTCNHAD